MLTTLLISYLILNLITIIWVLLDYILYEGKVFMVSNNEEALHAVILLSIPPINIFVLALIVYQHAKNK